MANANKTAQKVPQEVTEVSGIKAESKPEVKGVKFVSDIEYFQVVELGITFRKGVYVTDNEKEIAVLDKLYNVKRA